jgi:mono/diheme cytochrome c family protein
MTRPLTLWSITLVLSFFSLGCESEKEQAETADAFTRGSISQQQAQYGFEMFHDSSFGDEAVACSDCHADFLDSLDVEHIRPGHSILGVTSRSSTWYGEFSDEALQETAFGAAKCALIYQSRGTTLTEALSPTEAEALISFYRFVSVGDESQPNEWISLSYPGDPRFKRDSIVAIADSLSDLKGDEARGKIMFGKACASCHSGSSQSEAPSPRRLRRYLPRVFLQVRAGKGIMPFFSYDKLSNQDIADIKEWLYRGARE